MILVQLSHPVSTFPCDVIRTLSFNTYLINCTLQDYSIISEITSVHNVVSMCPVTIDPLDCYYSESHSYTTIQPKSRLDDVLDAIDEVISQPPTTVCFAWQIPRNYVLDYRITLLLEAGHIVVCSGGQSKLPLLDLSPVAADGVIKVGSDDTTGKTNWYDCYDYIIDGTDDSGHAAHQVANMLAENVEIPVEYELSFYSDSTIRSAPWARRVIRPIIPAVKFYEFMPVANLRYVAGEQLLPIKPGDTVSVLYGNTLLSEYGSHTEIICKADESPKGMTFDISNGWLYGTFKYRQNMFHRFQVDLNGQFFEFHIISCDNDNKPSYEECKQKYYNREYSAPPFGIREYWVPMSKPVKLLEPGDPWIRTYNLNDMHLYRKFT